MPFRSKLPDSAIPSIIKSSAKCSITLAWIKRALNQPAMNFHPEASDNDSPVGRLRNITAPVRLFHRVPQASPSTVIIIIWFCLSARSLITLYFSHLNLLSWLAISSFKCCPIIARFIACPNAAFFCLIKFYQFVFTFYWIIHISLNKSGIKVSL